MYDDGFAADDPHLYSTVTKLSMKAGADLEAVVSDGGFTPLHLTVVRGHSKMLSALVETEEIPNGRSLYRIDNATAVPCAAQRGHVPVTRDQGAPSRESELAIDPFESVGADFRPSGCGNASRALEGGTRADPGTWGRGLC